MYVVYVRSTGRRDSLGHEIHPLQSLHRCNIQTPSQHNIRVEWRPSADIRRSPGQSPPSRRQGSNRTPTDCSPSQVLITSVLSSTLSLSLLSSSLWSLLSLSLHIAYRLRQSVTQSRVETSTEHIVRRTFPVNSSPSLNGT